jgi:lipopolysaccharide/colanic/teichoic acid biosynthesis glycosyltransferase
LVIRRLEFSKIFVYKHFQWIPCYLIEFVENHVNVNRAGVPLQRTNKRIEPQQAFLSRLLHECRRAERSRQRLILVLIDGSPKRLDDVPALADALSSVIRETDVQGWYHTGTTLGVLFTELGSAEAEAARSLLTRKVEDALRHMPSRDELAISSYILPHDLTQRLEMDGSIERIYDCIDDLSSQDRDRKFKLGVKRAIDVIGSLFFLTLFAPIMAVIALGVKLGSPGPVLFRQTRIGQRGKKFTFLKFRSMRNASDPAPHENYVKDFIRGVASRNASETGERVFKLTQDPRVTPLGGFLRKTSLDELPQFWNVLRGDMSLVGPRPPIPYEIEYYDTWHQRRVLELKPGITGLWQVSGRNLIGFDDMVRLDVQYARRWSIGLDLKILLQTPLAVLRGGGAH